MKYTLSRPLMILLALSVSACSNMPQMFWSVDEGNDQPAYAKASKGAGMAAHRVPLEVPPTLRAELEVPASKNVAVTHNDKLLPTNYRKAVAGKYVGLDARRYKATADQVFSATIDAMTSMNLPVQSVDSPSGTLTTDWIRKGSGKANAISMFTGIFDLGTGASIVRYRYVVRVLRSTVAGNEQARLEIRTIGQIYKNGSWRNSQLKKKAADDLFAAAEEQLARVQAQAPKPAAVEAPAAEPLAAAPVAPVTPVLLDNQ
ncbi:MAG: hypothetical protein R8K50_07930 [Mariprofundus sp.]